MYLAVLGGVVLGGEKEEGDPALLATEAAPHHYAGGMLHVHHDVTLLVTAHCRQPPQLHRSGGLTRQEVNSSLSLPVYCMYTGAAKIFQINKTRPLYHIVTVIVLLRRGSTFANWALYFWCPL